MDASAARFRFAVNRYRHEVLPSAVVPPQVRTHWNAPVESNLLRKASTVPLVEVMIALGFESAGSKSTVP